MARQCAITGKKRMSGCNVSHSQRHTKRSFLPNVRKMSFLSDLLGMVVKLKVSSHGLRTIEKNGGIDNYMLKAKNSKLTDAAKSVKKKIEKASEAKKAA